jgi:hypothetical protein
MLMRGSSARHLLSLAHRVGRLTPDWRNPERYFETRDEIQRELKRIARDLGAA